MFIVGLSYNVPQMPSSYYCWGLSTAIINCLYSEGTGVSRQLFVQDVGSQTIFLVLILLYLDELPMTLIDDIHQSHLVHS